ncbi:putative unusual protein kinase regulating ubiquinone biosynthesis (AarF/ABC1/UbiB family) [Amycolatopsis bartoniae]|uniref:ABC transporter ATP-binding protein n=1 Tax=Amycolatopsis bartoniae TaxID=941986 RepID=A0A8H9MDL1_9PSEU|nr:AarF/ABC1/UbiB kinase family protein [Amycolatopsis bartoniae]MBB2938780.1 putative unusual protein kinase regulating ubiquinone biosynthesis (AarF/ABC1/UbiB family) [Amycolatopsis bartoniae]TVS98851.1 AarF/ABC1/UbiB kinase family protein [Amycolatopsis bartoniae]GHF80099.1 ABC transporter ATP-binding protein [Amycolatopsis bartoniae]
MTDFDDSADQDGTGIPRRTAARTAKLASLPLGIAGRAVGGWGRRLTGQSAEEVNATLSAKAAEQLFEVLGALKGGAMKFGQALSVFEAAVPDEMAAPYRDALTRLQAAAPPMSSRQTHRVLAEQLGRSWRGRFQEFDDEPTASASIGQVHRAVWHDGREVAVKVQYPGADEALRSDLRQLQRFSRLFQAFVPGTDVKPLLAELAARMDEELDYRGEADNQRAFAKAFEGDDEVRIPRVVASAPKTLVTEWLTGTPLAKIIAGGDTATRNSVGTVLAEFHYSSPARAGLLHSDPHPGNFLLLDDGRLGVIDFGAVARLPHGIPRQLGEMTRLALEGRSQELMKLLREAGFVRPGTDLRAEDVLAYLAPFTEPLANERFHFTRRWMQRQALRLGDSRGQDFRVGRSLNLPPEYLMIHRVTAGSTGILCQLDAEIPARGIVERWQPGFAD